MSRGDLLMKTHTWCSFQFCHDHAKEQKAECQKLDEIQSVLKP